MNNIKVSIIVPVYNSEQYISKCLDSILGQTYKNIELIIINDGSKDNSLNICKKYYENNKNIIKLINNKNQGVAKTRNDGIKISTGKYIMFIDNDDFIDKDYIEKYVRSIENNNSDIVIGGYRRVNTKNKTLFTKIMKNEVYRYIQLAPWGKIYKRDFLIKNELQFLDYSLGEDVYFNVCAYFCTNKISIIDYVGYNWFYNENSVSNSIQNSMKKNVNPVYLLNKIYDKNKNNNVINKELYDYFFIRYITWYLLFSTKKSDKKLIIERFDSLFNFLQENNINYYNNSYKSIFKKNSDEFKTKLIVNILLFFKRINLAKKMLIIYSKL